MDYGSETTHCILTIYSGTIFFFFWGGGGWGHNYKANTHIFFHVYLNFLQALHIVNSLKITLFSPNKNEVQKTKQK